MNQKHKQAFQELRQWCERWDGYIDEQGYIGIGSREYYPSKIFNTRSSTLYIDGYHFNFMEQENDNTEK